MAASVAAAWDENKRHGLLPTRLPKGAHSWGDSPPHVLCPTCTAVARPPRMARIVCGSSWRASDSNGVW